MRKERLEREKKRRGEEETWGEYWAKRRYPTNVEAEELRESFGEAFDFFWPVAKAATGIIIFASLFGGLRLGK